MTSYDGTRFDGADILLIESDRIGRLIRLICPRQTPAEFLPETSAWNEREKGVGAELSRAWS
jgi:hypothetical protein